MDKFYFYLSAALCGFYLIVGIRAAIDSADTGIWKHHFRNVPPLAWLAGNKPLIIIFWLPILVFGIVYLWIKGYWRT